MAEIACELPYFILPSSIIVKENERINNLLLKLRLISSLGVPVSFSLIQLFQRSASIGLALFPERWPNLCCPMVIELLGCSTGLVVDL